MSRFIRLHDMLINTNDIHKIFIQSNKYFIDIISKDLYGVHFLSVGWISSQTSRIEVCEAKHPIDYKKITDWIHKNEYNR